MVMEAMCDWDLLDFGGHGIQLATDLKVGSAYAPTHCFIKHGCNWGKCRPEPAQPKNYSLSHRIQISLLQRIGRQNLSLSNKNGYKMNVKQRRSNAKNELFC
uniref:Pept_C1 domain-containing protein n=1 Tax=Globodera pallida TaxID=36090 RepID=A0A183BMG3_GLOPA